ncbi:MAG TPA: hypothetical protein VGN36_00870 [Sphingorhabdus sp.]|jgi:hypothetical protein|nr:hypothetical protein [Sphingorhabdus sp.]
MDNLARPEEFADFGRLFTDAVLADGSVAITAPLATFISDGAARPDLRSPYKYARGALVADIAHFLNISHGRHPGIIDYAAHKIVDDAARKWLVRAIDGFAVERGFLNALTVAAGPERRRHGENKVAALITSQAKNFEMLASSDRKGCPAGAALAFAIDWQRTRPLLAAVALHVGTDVPQCALPDIRECSALAEKLGGNDAYARAMRFGGEQLLAQQRGLWQLIAARHAETLAASLSA